MNDYTFAQAQVVELRDLLTEVDDDPVLGPQFRDRLRDAEEKLRGYSEGTESDILTPLPRTAIFLRGMAVKGSEAIRAGLAGKVLIQYEKMFVEQAISNERQTAKDAGLSRRPSGSERPGLMFTGTPRGSFGLEFVPQVPEEAALRDSYASALNSITEAIIGVASPDIVSHEGLISGIPPAVLRPMKQLMKILAHNSADIRLAFEDSRSTLISANQISLAVERLEKEITSDDVKMDGVFYGVTINSGRFDFVTTEGTMISGDIDANMSEEELFQINRKTGEVCHASFQKITVILVTRGTKITYVLLGAVANLTK